MASFNYHSKLILQRILGTGTEEELATRFARRKPETEPLPPRLPGTNDPSTAALEARRAALAELGIRTEQLAGRGPELRAEELAGNIENLVGFARIPLGVIGPLRVIGSAARGDFFVPLATSEGALVASYNRGAMAISQSGGAVAACLTEAVARAPCFQFENLSQAGRFLAWVLPRFEEFQSAVASTSRHCQLLDLRTSVLGKEVYLVFEYTTADASGQNMVTIATEAICRHILASVPVQPRHWYIDGNLSGDKKATMLAFNSARGKKVVSEAVIERPIVAELLHTSPQDMVRYWQVSVLGGVQSGSIGVQGHYANALAAMFIACGQDAATVSEASVGVTRMDVTDEGDLYVSVSMPNLIVGTVGGGTKLPTARECLEMMGCTGEGAARKLAEICCATALAGEISIIAAMSHGDFASAHARLGRSGKGERK
jgi:hydroxymethylglutaryl-CoA reductase (NADPH)